MTASVSEIYDEFPFPARYFDVGGQHMHYVDEGQGSVVVLLHGNPTWSFYFRKIILALRHRYRVIAPDHIGCGLSDKPRDYPYTLATHIRNVERLLEHLSVNDVTLGVHDWGGAIGMGWAVRHPERLKRLVIFNTAAFLGPCPWRIRVCRLPLVGDVVVRGLNGFVRGALLTACQDRARLTSSVRRGYLMPYDSFANRVGVLRFVEDIPLNSKAPSYAVVRRIEAGLAQFRDRPVLICWGGRDYCFNDHFLERWRAVFPQAEVHRFADSGHYVVEDAHERIVPLMRAFLRE